MVKINRAFFILKKFQEVVHIGTGPFPTHPAPVCGDILKTWLALGLSKERMQLILSLATSGSSVARCQGAR